jgi:hypothetical protein
LIKKYLNGPDDSDSVPAFSTDSLDVFFQRALDGFDADTHTGFSDVYTCYRRGAEYYRPLCAVYVEHYRYTDGRVLNCVLKCDLGFSACDHPAFDNSMFVEDLSRVRASYATECLFGIQEFAGPVTLAHMHTKGFHTQFADEDLYFELNDQLFLAALAGSQQQSPAQISDEPATRS